MTVTPTSYADARKLGHDRLLTIGLESQEAAAQSEWLLAWVCGCGRAELCLRSREPLDSGLFAEYQALLERRVCGEPLQYIVGAQCFMGYEFFVDARVLIPRLDTEVLCERALEVLPEDANATVLDVGTGSGALAASIALKRPRAKVTALDVSEAALAVASMNAKRLGAEVRFVRSDFFAQVVGERFDLIVSNPPYISHQELDQLSPDVRREPLLALDGGEDGLDAYRVLARDGAAHLNPGGCLMVEVGATQAEAVAALFAASIGETRIDRDLQGAQRVVRTVYR